MVGCLEFRHGTAATVGAGLYVIFALQWSGLIFYLRQARNEIMHSYISLFFLVHVAATLIFLIIVAVWAGVGRAAPTDGVFATAVAFSVFDFLINVGMLVWTFIGGKNDHGGGFTEPPVTSV